MFLIVLIITLVMSSLSTSADASFICLHQWQKRAYDRMLAFTSLLLSSFQATFKDECKFKETLLPNNYNAYESSVYKGFYVALSKHGRLKRGNKATTAMTVTHFLPRIWADSCNNSSFALVSLRDLKTDTRTYKELQEYHQNSTYSFFNICIFG